MGQENVNQERWTAVDRYISCLLYTSTPIQPVYPVIARTAGVQGTVVLEATISTAGRIESLQVVSGPPMLRGAARDAVEVARYRPYKLNGQPTEVQTTITVVFRLGE